MIVFLRVGTDDDKHGAPSLHMIVPYLPRSVLDNSIFLWLVELVKTLR